MAKEKIIQISIALATYNGGKYLKEQLDSILKQTIKPNEFIISDDNSNDNTILIIEEFKKKAPFDVILLQNNKKGFNTNFENALKNVTGDLVFICDQDDVWLENKIEIMLDYFKKNPQIYLAIHDINYCNSNLTLLNETKIERYKKYKYPLNEYVTGMSTVIKKELLELCFPFSNCVNYDTWLHKCAIITGTKGIVYDILALYRRHEENATNKELINKNTKTNYINSLLNKFEINHKDAVFQKIALNEDLVKFISTNEKNISFSAIDTIEVLHDIKVNILNLRKRYKIQNQQFLKRMVSALLYYYKGGYKNNSGILSMLKDILKA